MDMASPRPGSSRRPRGSPALAKWALWLALAPLLPLLLELVGGTLDRAGCLVLAGAGILTTLALVRRRSKRSMALAKWVLGITLGPSITLLPGAFGPLWYDCWGLAAAVMWPAAGILAMVALLQRRSGKAMAIAAMAVLMAVATAVLAVVVMLFDPLRADLRAMVDIVHPPKWETILSVTTPRHDTMNLYERKYGWGDCVYLWRWTGPGGAVQYVFSVL